MSWFSDIPASRVSACIPAIDVIQRQVARVRERVETAVVEVCQRFGAMASNSNRIVSLATQNEDSGEKKLIDQAWLEIHDLLDHLTNGNEIIADFSKQFIGLQAQLKEIRTSLAEVDTISRRARMVALNGRLEAVKAGDKGMAFGEVASETRSLASNVSRISQFVSKQLDSFAGRLQQVSERAQAHAVESNEKVDSQIESARLLIDELEKSQHTLDANLNEATDLGRELSGDIARTVTLLQFQDEISQQLEHVIFASEGIQNKLRDVIPENRIDFSCKEAQEFLAELESRYTMDQERMAHDDQEMVIEKDDCSVELF